MCIVRSETRGPRRRRRRCLSLHLSAAVLILRDRYPPVTTVFSEFEFCNAPLK